MTELTQKTLITRRTINIKADGLLVSSKNIREDLEYVIKFEELGFDLVKKRIKTANLPFYFFLLFDAFYVVLLIISAIDKDPFLQQLFWLGALLIFSFFTFLAYSNRNKDVVYLTGGSKTLELAAHIPATNIVNDFIESIHFALREYYKKKYLELGTDIPIEIRTAQLRWLKEIKAVSEEEYTEHLTKSKTEAIIGFNRNSY